VFYERMELVELEELEELMLSIVAYLRNVKDALS
jgi:hypothetical protein